MRWLGWEMGIESKNLFICNDLGGVELSWIPSSSTHFSSYCLLPRKCPLLLPSYGPFVRNAADAGASCKGYRGVSQRGVMAVTAGSPVPT